MSSTSEIRVARIIARLNVGGPAIHVCNLTARLPSPFVSRLYVGDVARGEEEMENVIKREGVEPIRVPGLGRALGKADASAFFRLVRELRMFRPHIVHTHTAKAGTLGRLAARATGVPIVVHTFHGHVFDGYFSPLATRAFLAIERTLARLTDAVVTLSPRQERDIVRRYRVTSPSKVHVIPLGFDFAKLDHVEDRKGELRQELGIDANAPLVAAVGRLTAIKDHALLLQSFRLMADGAHLVVVGGGEEEANLRTLARELGVEKRVHFLGFRSDLDRILADARVVALTSHNEGTPVALIEALAAGRLPVGTAVGGVEDVLQGGRWGKLVRSRSPADFARALTEALEEEQEVDETEISSRKAYARLNFGVFRLVDDHVALYKRLLAEHCAL